MATLKQRRKSDRDRRARWVERQRKEGKRIVTAVLGTKAQAVLIDEKERTGESNTAIIERALLSLSKAGQKNI